MESRSLIEWGLEIPRDYFDKKEVFAWNMVNFQSVKYGI